MRQVLLLLLIISSVAVSAHESRNKILSVNGQGNVFKAPDILKFTVVVEEKGENSKQLSDKVNAKTNQVLELMSSFDIPEKDIQAMSVSLHPWYERERQSNVQKGFVFTRNINVTLRDFAVYPAILNQLFELQTTRVDSFRYEVEQQQAAYLQALTLATEDARRRAQQLAKDMKVGLGEVVNIEETSQYHPAPQPSARSQAVFSSEAQYLPGINEVNASVTVMFKIK